MIDVFVMLYYIFGEIGGVVGVEQIDGVGVVFVEVMFW